MHHSNSNFMKHVENFTVLQSLFKNGHAYLSVSSAEVVANSDNWELSKTLGNFSQNKKCHFPFRKQHVVLQEGASVP